MIVKISIDKDYCIIAVSHKLYYGNRINSITAFKQAVKEYAQGYGAVAVDEHESAYFRYKEAATEIVNKYFK